MPEFTLKSLKPGAHIHFIGIGGISMSALAEILVKNAYTISGSDIRQSPLTDKLKTMGVSLLIGHSKENVTGADLIVYTAAVKGDNPEMIAAKELGIMTIDRPTLLGAIMKDYKHAIAIAGTHGKTTTTSMVSSILMHADVDPTILVGEVLDSIDGNVRIGNSTYFVTEACEYCESFLKFHPYIGVILNIEADHLDYFKDLEHIITAFKKFTQLVPDNGYVVVCGDDPNGLKAVDGTKAHVITYGTEGPHCDWKAANITFNENGFPGFDMIYKGNTLATVQLNVPGMHNVYNALAAAACAYVLKTDATSIANGLHAYKGARRRFEIKGKVHGVTIVSDYAHHPTEVKATLKAAVAFPHNKVWCVFQPHAYTRTHALINEFSEAFQDADRVIITDIYAAREKDDGKVHAKDLVNIMNNKDYPATYIADFKDIASYVKENAGEGDLVLTMGAGSIDQLSEILLHNE